MRAQARFAFLGMALLAFIACGNNHVTLDLTGGTETIGATVYVNGEKTWDHDEIHRQ